MRKAIFALACLLLLSGFYRGSISGGSLTPIVNGVTCNTGSPAVATQAVTAPTGGACGTASNTPTSWSISGCSSNLSIDNSGNITVNSTGAAVWTADNTSAVVSCSPTITATNASGSGNATITVNVYADGSAAAVAATTPQPTLLNGYGSGGVRHRQNGFQPNWNVAGVDYPVGIATGTSLQDPLTATLPGSCTRNSGNHQITCASTTATFNGWDFSLEGGWQLICNGGGVVTVTNSNFAIGTNGNAMISGTSTCIMTLTHNVINANALNDNLNGTNINFNGSGQFTAKYNIIEDAAGDWIDLGGGGASLVEYNFFFNAGQLAGTHPDWLQLGGGTYTNVVWNYNTMYQTTATVGPGSQGVGVAGFNTWSVTNTEMARNTTITQTGAKINYAFSVGVSNLTGTASTHDNFIDLSGTASFMHTQSTCASTCPGGGTSLASSNTNMVTGAAISNNWN